MRHELTEDAISSLETEYYELQDYLLSTADKLKEAATTLANISKSYNSFKSTVYNQFSNFVSCLDFEKIGEDALRGTIEDAERFQNVFDKLYDFDNVHIECDDNGTIYIHFLLEAFGEDEYAATIAISSEDTDMWNALKRNKLEKNTKITLELVPQLDLEWAIHSYVSKTVKQL